MGNSFKRTEDLLRMKKYDSRISWCIFVVLVMVLGLMLGGVFDVGTTWRTVIAVALAIAWFGMDAYFRRHHGDESKSC